MPFDISFPEECIIFMDAESLDDESLSKDGMHIDFVQLAKEPFYISYPEECVIFMDAESLADESLSKDGTHIDFHDAEQAEKNGEYIQLAGDLIQSSWIPSSSLPHPPDLHAEAPPPAEPPPEPPPVEPPPSGCPLWTNFGELNFHFRFICKFLLRDTSLNGEHREYMSLQLLEVIANVI